MAVTYAPERYTLDEGQLAGALALAGLQPGPTSRLAHIPPPRDPVGALRGTKALADGRLAGSLVEALRIALHPAGGLSVVANRAGSTDWRELEIVRGEGDGPFVSRSIQSGLDLAVLPTVTQAVVAVDAALSLTDFVAPPGDSYRMSLAGYAAVLALSDALQAAYLRGRLARAPQAQPSWGPDELEKIFSEGIAATDTRWATTAARFVSPVPLAATSGRMATGLAELRGSDLVRQTGRAWTLTEAGYVAALALGQLVVTGGLSVIARRGQLSASVSQTTVFRSVTSIRLATWSKVGADDAEIHLAQVAAGSALEFVRAMITLPVDASRPDEAPARTEPTAEVQAPSPQSETATSRVPKFCPQCGTATVAGKAFCGSCGTKLTTGA